MSSSNVQVGDVFIRRFLPDVEYISTLLLFSFKFPMFSIILLLFICLCSSSCRSHDIYGPTFEGKNSHSNNKPPSGIVIHCRWYTTRWRSCYTIWSLWPVRFGQSYFLTPWKTGIFFLVLFKNTNVMKCHIHVTIDILNVDWKGRIG